MGLSTGEKPSHSYLASTVTATSTSYIDSGLIVYLAANSTYYIQSLLNTTANGDGIRYKYNFTGTVVTNGLNMQEAVSGLIQQLTFNAENTNTKVDEIIEVRGLVRTGSGGKLYVTFRKNTDVTDDTPIVAGSHVVATLL